jgi:hypothetical protein
MTLDREGVKALAAAARAFARAQKLGYAWIGDEGCFETCEDWGAPPSQKIDNPDQLRLA